MCFLVASCSDDDNSKEDEATEFSLVGRWISDEDGWAYVIKSNGRFTEEFYYSGQWTEYYSGRYTYSNGVLGMKYDGDDDFDYYFVTVIDDDIIKLEYEDSYESEVLYLRRVN